jgi:hypothetical protein
MEAVVQKVVQKIADKAKILKSWNDITSTLNQIGFLQSFDKPFVCLKTVNINDVGCIGLEQDVVDKIKEGMKNVSKVKSTILDEITIQSTDETIVCTKIFVQGKKELTFKFSVKDILNWNVIQVKKIVYVDVICKKYEKRNLTL